MGERRGAGCLHDAVLREITETEHEIRFLFQIPEQADGRQGQRTVVLRGWHRRGFQLLFCAPVCAVSLSPPNFSGGGAGGASEYASRRNMVGTD